MVRRGGEERFVFIFFLSLNFLPLFAMVAHLFALRTAKRGEITTQ